MTCSVLGCKSAQKIQNSQTKHEQFDAQGGYNKILKNTQNVCYSMQHKNFNTRKECIISIAWMLSR